MDKEITTLIKLLLPEFLVDYFDIVKVDTLSDRVDIYLEEKRSIPENLSDKTLTSHGFHKQAVIRDFPIRGKQVFLYVKRRRWKEKSTSEVYSRDWELLAEGTRMTKEFSSFLKGIN